MNFYMPAKVYSEKNCVMNHAAELAALGTRALIVTGKSSARRCGAFADVTQALEKYGVSWVEFAEVEENPSVETIMRARKVGCKVEADFVIGIGGGSPMDAAKAVALMKVGAHIVLERDFLSHFGKWQEILVFRQHHP